MKAIGTIGEIAPITDVQVTMSIGRVIRVSVRKPGATTIEITAELHVTGNPPLAMWRDSAILSAGLTTIMAKVKATVSPITSEDLTTVNTVLPATTANPTKIEDIAPTPTTISECKDNDRILTSCIAHPTFSVVGYSRSGPSVVGPALFLQFSGSFTMLQTLGDRAARAFPSAF